jgi:hypothetical protein
MSNQAREETNRPATETTKNRHQDGVVSTGKIRAAKDLSMAIITLLFVQFLLGMWTNLFVVFPEFSPSVNPLDQVFLQGPYILAAHIITGVALGILSISVFILSVLARNKRAIVLACAGLGSILLAGESGIEFVLGWYANDVLSFSMALGFVFSFVVYFATLSFRKDEPQVNRARCGK